VIVALAAEDWLDSTIALIRQAWSQARQSRSSSQEIAVVEPCYDEPGWYRVQRRLSGNELEFISEGNLAYGSGDRALEFDVLEVIADDEQVRVRASAAAPRERLSLCIRHTGTAAGSGRPRQRAEGSAGESAADAVRRTTAHAGSA